jgi:hypothetical protein
MKTTSFEFVEWIEFLRLKKQEKYNEVEKQDYYLAQVATEIRRSFTKNPNSVRVQDFLIKFKSPITKIKEKASSSTWKMHKSILKSVLKWKD